MRAIYEAPITKPKRNISITKAFKAVDYYFFCEEDAEIRPYFYGSVGFGTLVTILITLF